MTSSIVCGLTIALLTAGPALALDRSLVVINGLAETLSRVNLESGVVDNNVAILGLVPNQVFVDNEGRRDTLAYIVNSTSNDLQVVHVATGTTVGTIPLGADRNPYSLAFIDDSVVAVSNLVAGTITEVDTRAQSIVAEYPVGAGPEGMLYHDGLLYVCLTAFDFGTFTYGQGQVAIVDPDLDSVVARIDVGTNPQAILRDHEGELLVLCTGDFATVTGSIYVIDPASRVVTDSVATGGWPGHFALAPDGRLYIAGGGWVGVGEVYLMDSRSNTMLRDAGDPIATGVGVVGMAADITGFGYACSFSADQVSRLTGDSATLSYGLGDGPGFAAVYEPFPPGDVDNSGAVAVSDIIFTVNYLFKGGPPPGMLVLGDANRNCVVGLSDVITIVNYIFRGGPAPQYGCY